MVKIVPINSVKTNNISKLFKNSSEHAGFKPIHAKPHNALVYTLITGVTAGKISTFLHDFNKTSTENENYFQLKINPETGKPYEADAFQRAAAMNLYLGNDVL